MEDVGVTACRAIVTPNWKEAEEQFAQVLRSYGSKMKR
jgi:hypothetical protein